MCFILIPSPSPGLPDILQRPSQVASYDLFRDEAIHCELHLIVCQSIDQQHVIVIGCRYVVSCTCAYLVCYSMYCKCTCTCTCTCRGSRDNDDEHRACYVSILPRPPQPPGTTPAPDHSLSIHFKFDILSPFPSFIPTLSLKIPGTPLTNHML